MKRLIFLWNEEYSYWINNTDIIEINKFNKLLKKIDREFIKIQLSNFK